MSKSIKGQWSLLDLVHKDDLKAVAQLPEVKDDGSGGKIEDKWEQLLPEPSDDEL